MSDIPDEHNPEVPAMPDYRPGFDERRTTQRMRELGVIEAEVIQPSPIEEAAYGMLIRHKEGLPGFILFGTKDGSQREVEKWNAKAKAVRAHLVRIPLPPLEAK